MRSTVVLSCLLLSVLLAFSAPQTSLPADPPPQAPPLKAMKAFRLMDAEREKVYRGLLPKVEDAKVQAMLADACLLLYTEEEMPRCHQDFSGMLQGIHSPWYNISATKPQEPFGNGNREFPWGHTAGTDEAENCRSFKFLLLPEGKPIAVFQHEPEQLFSNVQASSCYGWLFPVGTVVGEVLIQKDGKGTWHPFEVRIRTRTSETWVPDVFRPFATNRDMLAELRKIRPEADTSNVTISTVAFRNRHPDKVVIDDSGVLSGLPEMSEEEVRTLLDRPFVSVAGKQWGKSNADGSPIDGPMSNQAFGLIPKGYTGCAVHVTKESCMKCHDSTQQHVNRFENARDWYGSVRGSSGILSFHPFDASCISDSGTPRGVKFRQDLIDAGIVATFDERKHGSDDYRRIKGIR